MLDGIAAPNPTKTAGKLRGQAARLKNPLSFPADDLSCRIQCLFFLRLQPALMQNGLGITARLLASLKHQVTRGLECDRAVIIGRHWTVCRIAGILLIDKFG